LWGGGWFFGCFLGLGGGGFCVSSKRGGRKTRGGSGGRARVAPAAGILVVRLGTTSRFSPRRGRTMPKKRWGRVRGEKVGATDRCRSAEVLRVYIAAKKEAFGVGSQTKHKTEKKGSSRKKKEQKKKKRGSDTPTTWGTSTRTTTQVHYHLWHETNKKGDTRILKPIGEGKGEETKMQLQRCLRPRIQWRKDKLKDL